MRNKTIFKQMYLVDPIAYNRISNTPTTSASTPIILGKSNIKISPQPTLKVSAPVTTEISNPSTHPNTQSETSVGTQSEVLHTKSVGSVTIPRPTKEDVSSQTMFKNKGEERLNNLDSRIDNRVVRKSNRAARSSEHLSRNTPYTSHYLSSTGTHQSIAPVNNFQEDIMDYTIAQNSTTPIQSQSQIENTSKIPIEYSPPTTVEMIDAKPFEIEAGRWLDVVAQQNNVVNSLNRNSDVIPLQHPQLMNYTTNHSSLSEPKPMDIGDDNSPKALPPPRSSSKALPPSTPPPDCEECSVTPYKKYDVSLPFETGLPSNVFFTCTICQTNFNTKKKLQRHMKNIHDAFNQVEKGIKRKSKQNKTSAKKLKTSQEIVPYLLYNLENLT